MKKIKFPIIYKSVDIDQSKKNKIKTKINKKKLLLKENIKKNFVVIKVEYSNLNYKDFLMSQGHSGLVKRFPHTAGIDASGTICYSNSKKFKIKDRVFVIAKPLGVETNGSFSEYITIPDKWVEKLPQKFTSKEIMMIGTSGFTAIKALNKTLGKILKHKKIPVLVTGALSNVGMFLIFLLTNIGVSVEVVTSKKNNIKILKKMGVSEVHILSNFIKTHNFSLMKEKYSVIFENLGGNMMSVCLKYLIKKGILVSIGNILGNISNINILPLILREVKIFGVNAESSGKKEREKIFQLFKTMSLKRKSLERTKVINLTKVCKILNLRNFDKKGLRYIVKI